jgi:hypothetical protein
MHFQFNDAYALLTADGFTLQTRISGLTMNVPGVLEGIGVVNMPGVERTVAGGNAVLGLVIWTGSGNSFFEPPYYAADVLTFVNPTSDYTIPPPQTPVALDGMYTDLILPPIPEPGVFALAGLGAALLLVFRRRIA